MNDVYCIYSQWPLGLWLIWDLRCIKQMALNYYSFYNLPNLSFHALLLPWTNPHNIKAEKRGNHLIQICQISIEVVAARARWIEVLVCVSITRQWLIAASQVTTRVIRVMTVGMIARVDVCFQGINDHLWKNSSIELPTSHTSRRPVWLCSCRIYAFWQHLQ